jgi:hypothetical protein
MKLKSRLPISEPFAAAALAVVSAILIAGCASGERVGKFWDKGDVKSSDAYVAAEKARDQSIAANSHAGANAAGRVSFTSGTEDDTTGHAALPDFPDPPAAPPAPNSTASSAKADNSAASARSAQSAGAAVGSAQIAGAGTGGSIVAPYVQKRAPSGALDNRCHDGEIVKPKQVYAKQLDPFAATDAEPFLAPKKVVKQPAPPVAGTNSAPAVAKNPDSNRLPIELMPNGQASATALPSFQTAAGASAASSGEIQTVATTGAPPTPAQSGPPIVTATPATSAPKPASIGTAGRPRVGVRLGDEELNDEEESSPSPVEKQVVQPAATQAPTESHAKVASSPYESDVRHDAGARTCVTAPVAPSRNATKAVAPPVPSPVQDTWESTKAAAPTIPSACEGARIAASAKVTDVAPPPGKTPLYRAPVLPVEAPRAARSSPAARTLAAPIESGAGRVSVDAPQALFDGPKTVGGSDPMIFDSATIHGRYTGSDALPAVQATADPFGAVPRMLPDASRHAKPAITPTPVKKSNVTIEGKSTSYWDDIYSSPTLKHTVLTAEFSVPAPPLPDDVQCRDKPASTLHAAERCLAGASADRQRGPRSRAWIVVGMVAGLALSSVVWRRWRSHSAPDGEPQV